MKVVLVHNHYDAEKLESVITEMRTLGRPKVRAYKLWNGAVQAIEGCHRLRACEALGVKPIIVLVSPDSRISRFSGLDYDDNTNPRVSEIGDAGNYSIEI